MICRFMPIHHRYWYCLALWDSLPNHSVFIGHCDFSLLSSERVFTPVISKSPQRPMYRWKAQVLKFRVRYSVSRLDHSGHPLEWSTCRVDLFTATPEMVTHFGVSMWSETIDLRLVDPPGTPDRPGAKSRRLNPLARRAEAIPRQAW